MDRIFPEINCQELLTRAETGFVCVVTDEPMVVSDSSESLYGYSYQTFFFFLGCCGIAQAGLIFISVIAT